MAKSKAVGHAKDGKRIGFIGVGLMGHGMAKNLLLKGFPVAVMGHKNRKPVDDLVKRGARELKTPTALARAADILFLCMPSSLEVENLVRRKGGLKDAARKGLIIVDTTTADPVSTLAIAAELKPLGVRFVDAPLTRTPKEAEDGRLNTFVGSDKKTFREIRPALEAWAENIFHVGAVGNGHKLKLVNNFIAMGFISVVAEALTTASKAGLDVSDLHRIVSAGPINSGIYQNVMKWVLEGDREAHKFTLANARKDIRYYNRLAEAVDSSAIVGSAARQLYEIANTLGYGDSYLPRLCDATAELNAAKLG